LKVRLVVALALVGLVVLALMKAISPKLPPPRNNMTFAGDSIMQGVSATNATATVVGRLTYIHPAWFIRNYSYAGASVTGLSAVPAMNPSAIAELLQVDTDVVFLGTNDWSAAPPLAKFGAAYGKFLDTLASAPNKPRVICVTPIWRCDEEQNKSNASGYTMDALRSAIATACHSRGDPVIDGLKLLPNDRSYYFDGCVHPNDRGYKYFASALNTALSSLVSP
jgi:lysophospholipase L1-like esterase